LGLSLLFNFPVLFWLTLNASGIAEVERHETRAAGGESR
jgi:hypothetical protein